MNTYVSRQYKARDVFVHNTKTGCHVQRPLQAFQIFCSLHRQQLKQRLPHLNNAQLSKHLGELWSEMTPDHKSLYHEEARKGKMEIQPFSCVPHGSPRMTSPRQRQKTTGDEDEVRTEYKFGGYVPPFHIFSSRFKKQKKLKQAQRKHSQSSHKHPPIQTLICKGDNRPPIPTLLCKGDNHYDHQRQHSYNATHCQDGRSWPNYGSGDPCYNSECNAAVTNLINSAGDYTSLPTHSLAQPTYPRPNSSSTMHYSNTLPQDHYEPVYPNPIQTYMNQDSLCANQTNFTPIQREPFYPIHPPVSFSPKLSPSSCDQPLPFLPCGPFSDSHSESMTPDSEISDSCQYQYQNLSPGGYFQTKTLTDDPNKSPYNQVEVRSNQFQDMQSHGTLDKLYQVREHQIPAAVQQGTQEQGVEEGGTSFVLIPCEAGMAVKLGWPLHILPKISNTQLQRLKSELTSSLNCDQPTQAAEAERLNNLLLSPHRLDNMIHAESPSTPKATKPHNPMTSDPRMPSQSSPADTVRMALNSLNQQFYSPSQKTPQSQQYFTTSTKLEVRQLELNQAASNHPNDTAQSVTSTSGCEGTQISEVEDPMLSSVPKLEQL